MFEIVKANIELLLKTGINLELQTIVNTMNFNEIELMYNFAKYNDIKMNFFRNITCEIDGNNRPLAYRISPEQEKLSYDVLHDKDTLIKSIEKKKECGIKDISVVLQALQTVILIIKVAYFYVITCRKQKSLLRKRALKNVGTKFIL